MSLSYIYLDLSTNLLHYTYMFTHSTLQTTLLPKLLYSVCPPKLLLLVFSFNKDLGRPDMWTGSDYDEKVHFGTHWIDHPYNNNMLGEYWCQIIVTSEQQNHTLHMSNVFTIEQPESYTTPQCSGIIQVSDDTLCSSPKTIIPVITITTIDTNTYNTPTIAKEIVQQSITVTTLLTSSKYNTDEIFASSKLKSNPTSAMITSLQLSHSPASITASSISSKWNTGEILASSELIFNPTSTTSTSLQLSHSPTSITALLISSKQNIDEIFASSELSFNLSTVSNIIKIQFTTSPNITENNSNTISGLSIIIGAIILIMMSIILLSAIILIVMTAVRRMKTKSQGEFSNFTDIVIAEMLILFSSLSPSFSCISGFTLKPNKR